MELKCHAELFHSIFLLLCFSIITKFSSASDSISAGQSLTFNNSLISKGGMFKLGFFSPGNSRKYYLGIWYNQISLQNRTYVWVSNRNTPVSDPLSELKLLDNGDLVLVESDRGIRLWSTNTTSKGIAQVVLRDDGNLVLQTGVKESDVYWQSFDYPTDTWLPDGRIGYDNRRLTCWKNLNDPSEGIYSVELDDIGEQYVFKWNNTKAYWNSGPWNGHIFSKNPELGLNYIRNFSSGNNVSEAYFTYNVYESITTRFVIDMWGKGGQYSWDAASGKWLQLWSEPGQQCEVYGFCGGYGICTQSTLPFCKCMEGFEPRDRESWDRLHGYSSGCVRKTVMQCEDQMTFLMVANVTLPSNPQSSSLEQAQCRLACLNNCSCVAYAYVSVCFIWDGDLLNVNQNKGVGNLYLKLAASEIKDFGIKKRGMKIGVIIGVVTIALSLSLVVLYFGLKKRLNRKATGGESKEEDPELPLIDYLIIETSTNNFSFSNKIGQGGFGPVYKGVLPTGGEIAVKRLSINSRQGLDEFMNEVVLIAKLQHRNLVRLLGCCIHGDERILVYEYMPNKSLDFFIFDKARSITLNWEKRFEIIVGIARGLLYLHRDSRLRIIHRDLKAANILLDSQMSPKISDFGMARAFGGDQTEENTKRVVGTYGYMSPEYATDGLFSMKSDVFSFGVLVLEIVSGTRNRGFRHVEHDLNLLGHAWNILIDRKALELVDPSIEKPFSESEILKCIHIGLLCVQKFPEDRPTMSSVLSMLINDGVMLPQPKQPGFYTERSVKVGSSFSEHTSSSKNDVTITLLEGR